MFTAVVDVLTTGCAWRHLPAQVGVSPATAHCRFAAWTEAGVWRWLHRAVLDRLGEQTAIDWSRAVVDAASVRAEKGGCADRSEPGRVRQTRLQLHVLTDAAGRPLAVAVSGANTHDSLVLIPLVQAIPVIRSRRGPRRRRPGKLHADTGEDYDQLRAGLGARRLPPRIARRGVDTSAKLSRHRWVIERRLAWLTGYRRLTSRYERSAQLFTAFPTPTATLTCHKKLAT